MKAGVEISFLKICDKLIGNDDPSNAMLFLQKIVEKGMDKSVIKKVKTNELRVYT